MRVAWDKSPITNPDVLAAAIPSSLERVCRKLEAMKGTIPEHVPRINDDARCNCARNPFFALYVAGEQALLEAVVYIQGEQAPAERNLVGAFAVSVALRSLALSEIDGFCAVCDHRGKTDRCRA